MSLTIPTKKKAKASKRNWIPTSIPAESFRTFAHGISALHIFDHGTKGRLAWCANNCAGHRMWRCNNHEDCDFMVQLKQHAPLDFKISISGNHTRKLKTFKRLNSACTQDQVSGSGLRIRLRIPLCIPAILMCIPHTYPPMYSPLYLHMCTRRKISSLVLTPDAGRLACL